MTQRFMPTLLALTLAGGLVLPASTATAGKVTAQTQYFAVHGGTLAEIDRSLNTSGPIVSGTGQRHPGATSVQFDGRVGYKRVPRGCAVGRTDIQLKLKTTLPKWRRPKRAAARTAIVWKTLAQDIARHEKKHSDIAVSYLKRLESALKNLSPERTCRQMETKANTVMARYLREHERAQREFDTIEGREVNMRLYRSLTRTMREARQ